MPVHDVGYRSWRGSMVPQSLRWWTIGETGIQLVYRSSWVRRLILFAWLPTLYWGVGFFVIERMVSGMTELASTASASRQNDESAPFDMGRIREEVRRVGEQARRDASRQGMAKIIEDSDSLSGLPKVGVLVDALESGDQRNIRHVFWSWLLMTFFRYPQSTIVIFLLGFIVPGLIARDMRSRALLLYFSRPIGRREYILGKLMIPAVYLVLVTVLPALAIYLWGLFLAPDLSAVRDTWDLPFRVVLAGLVLIIPTATLGLLLSSMTQESRFASFAWFAVWALGLAAFGAVLLARMWQLDASNVQIDDPFEDPVVKAWAPVSLYLGMGQVQSWIFGFETFARALPSLIVLSVVSVGSLGLLYRNVSRTAHGR